MVEIDRGTMPVERKNQNLTSYKRKMHAYLAAHAAKLHERQFGWKAFPGPHRHDRRASPAIHDGRVPHGLGPQLFFFATRSELRAVDPLAHA